LTSYAFNLVNDIQTIDNLAKHSVFSVWKTKVTKNDFIESKRNAETGKLRLNGIHQKVLTQPWRVNSTDEKLQ
jgi:hypothetical protein